MEPIPLPSPIHYELILQLLEKQTMTSLGQNQDLRNQVNQLIITMRKAASQQKRLEEIFQSSSMMIDHRWSINHFADQVDCS
ncbi:DUF5340 domain-containing protein [Dolichospermum planctonicum UHCC 0167]|jgi:hypothetical protein|uniref:DUF5340 domain-containing protein n=1 Tax=Dolichospermum planctonicum TaxID=136072 RepID=UPI0014434D9C|nr:DUF5340 domain-containing protein [Dolichospermum planctonicum]MCW9682791.1 DUF5340 domain-containing protein [Dolichospermum planctonicum UHCC 0167]